MASWLALAKHLRHERLSDETTDHGFGLLYLDSRICWRRGRWLGSCVVVQTMSEQLLVNERRAAKLLNVCERTLWGWRRAGIVPHIRIGRTVKYSVASLERWIAEQEAASLPPRRAINSQT
jgi:Helix-turn-helix domain